MAEEQDQSQKTEEPSQKRLADAHEKGDVVKSQEVSNWFMLAAGTLVLVTFGRSMASSLSALLQPFLSEPHTVAMDPAGLVLLTSRMLGGLASVLALPLTVLIAAAIAGNLVQHRPVLSTSRLEPKLDKLSPIKGFKRVFGLTALANFLKGLTKLALVAITGFIVLWPERHGLGLLVSADPHVVLPTAKLLAVRMLEAALVVLALLALLDYAYQRHEFVKRNRMTKQEVRDEFRQMEGDPMVKAKIRQLRADKARQRMMAQVPTATVVVTNPTHYAVALRYESGKMNAPVCVAKGIDSLALRIRAVAAEHKVPVVENPPLARTLYATVDIDEEVPPEHYKAVAGVIGYVLRLKGRL